MGNKIQVKHSAIVRVCGRLSTPADPLPSSARLMSSFVDMSDEPFSDRLKKAAKYAKVEWGQTSVARSLGLEKQTVDRWFGTGEPKPAMLFHIAETWHVDPRWLATGEGEMLSRPVARGLLPHEEDLLARYRDSDPRWQLSIRLLSYVATEDQKEVAGDVNIVLARAFGKHPQDIKYVSNRRVAAAVGVAPHVAARKAKVREGK